MSDALLPFLAIAASEVQGMFRLRELNLVGYRQVALAGDDSASQNLRAEICVQTCDESRLCKSCQKVSNAST